MDEETGNFSEADNNGAEEDAIGRRSDLRAADARRRISLSLSLSFLRETKLTSNKT